MWLRGLVESGGCVKAGVGLPSTAMGGCYPVVKREGQNLAVETPGTRVPASSLEWLGMGWV